MHKIPGQDGELRGSLKGTLSYHRVTKQRSIESTGPGSWRSHCPDYTILWSAVLQENLVGGYISRAETNGLGGREEGGKGQRGGEASGHLVTQQPLALLPLSHLHSLVEYFPLIYFPRIYISVTTLIYIPYMASPQPLFPNDSQNS